MAALSRRAHHVFMNFRGKDLRHGFVSHLTDALKRHNISFFIDTNEEKGRDLKHLFNRIHEAKVALVILSKRYAESKWCLEELRTIMERAEKQKMVVIPIFYKVSPDDVRRQKGVFGSKFSERRKISSSQEMEKWQSALKAVSNKIGFPLDHNRSEAKFIKEVVKGIGKALTTISPDERRHYDSIIVKRVTAIPFDRLPLALPWGWLASIGLIVTMLLAFGLIAEIVHKCASSALVVFARKAISRLWDDNAFRERYFVSISLCFLLYLFK